MSNKYHLLQVVGARPQIIKSAAIDRAVHSSFEDKIKLSTLHTGQHYDSSMSESFYMELGIKRPDINLNIGSGSHASQTAAMMIACEKAFKKQQPDGILIFGDTNSTLAAALAAYKLDIPVIHIEAGLRSFNLKMPEECNRIAADHLSTHLFCPTENAVRNLYREGLAEHEKAPDIENPGIYLSGDVMYDNSLFYAQRNPSSSTVQGIDLAVDDFILATCHRPVNTDDPECLNHILAALEALGKDTYKVILPVHPRLEKHKQVLERYGSSEHLTLIAPVGYLDMIQLESRCKMVITDSGGVQKESFFFKKPCIVMREESEWTELIENGNAVLCGNDPQKIRDEAIRLFSKELSFPAFYGSGQSAEYICQTILKHS